MGLTQAVAICLPTILVVLLIRIFLDGRHCIPRQALFDVQRVQKRIYVDEDPYFKVSYIMPMSWIAT